MSLIEARITELGYQLPQPFVPPARFVTIARSGALLFVSGHGPVRDGQVIGSGKVPTDIASGDAYEEARLAALNCLASIKQEVGSLDNVTRILKLFGMVNSEPTFTGFSEVINGASDLLVDVFGTEHARSAMGAQSLPGGIAVEVEMIVEAQEE